jgi:hypothetical protein
MNPLFRIFVNFIEVVEKVLVRVKEQIFESEIVIERPEKVHNFV